MSIQLEAAQPGAGPADLDSVYRLATGEVSSILPSARLIRTSFYSTCNRLKEFGGELNLGFTQVSSTFPVKRTEGAEAAFDTDTGTLAIAYRDYGSVAIRTDGEPFPGQEQLRIAASLVSLYLQQQGVRECNVSFIKMKRDTWEGSCRDLEQKRRCQFTVAGGQVFTPPPEPPRYVLPDAPRLPDGPP